MPYPKPTDAEPSRTPVAPTRSSAKFLDTLDTLELTVQHLHDPAPKTVTHAPVWGKSHGQTSRHCDGCHEITPAIGLVPAPFDGYAPGKTLPDWQEHRRFGTHEWLCCYCAPRLFGKVTGSPSLATPHTEDLTSNVSPALSRKLVEVVRDAESRVTPPAARRPKRVPLTLDDI